MAYGPNVVNSSSACQSQMRCNRLAKTSARTGMKSLMQSKLPHVDSTDRFDRANEDKGLVSSGSGARIGGRGLHHTTSARLCGVVCSDKPASLDADRVIIARGSVFISGSLPLATRPAQVEERTSPRTPKPLSRGPAIPPAPERRKPSSLATKGRKAWLPRTALWRADRNLCARSVGPRPETPAPPSAQTALSRRRVLQNQFGPGVAPRRAGAASRSHRGAHRLRTALALPGGAAGRSRRRPAPHSPPPVTVSASPRGNGTPSSSPPLLQRARRNARGWSCSWRTRGRTLKPAELRRLRR
jgi:hypothetical protein